MVTTNQNPNLSFSVENDGKSIDIEAIFSILWILLKYIEIWDSRFHSFINSSKI